MNESRLSRDAGILADNGLFAGTWSPGEDGGDGGDGGDGPLPLSHSHAEVELDLCTGGPLTYFLGGKLHELAPRRPAMFWGGVPHLVAEVSETLESVVWVTIPLGVFVRWSLPRALLGHLMAGRFLQEPPADDASATADWFGFRRWAAECAGGADDRLLALELEARVRRLSRNVDLDSAPEPPAPLRTPAPAVRLASMAGEIFREPVTAAEIAAACGLNASYAGQLFKTTYGIGLWEYVLRLRVSHAQSLLVTSDMEVLDVCYAAGFGSPARFYEAFRRFSGVPPRRFRAAAATPRAPRRPPARPLATTRRPRP